MKEEELMEWEREETKRVRRGYQGRCYNADQKEIHIVTSRSHTWTSKFERKTAHNLIIYIPGL